MKKELNYQEKRELLKSISRKAKQIRDCKAKNAKSDREALYWASRTINEILIDVLYKKNGAEEFKTFNEWRKNGKTVKKGEKALIIWGQPRTKTQEIKGEEVDEYSFFPMCYLFSDKQVYSR